MCWTSKKMKIKTSRKNIPIWKVVLFDVMKRKYVSPIKGFYYIPCTRYSAQMTFSVDEYFGVIMGHNGFHSFSSKLYYTYSRDIEKVSVYKKGLFLGEPIHNFSNDSYDTYLVIAKGYLPKGTRYAINKRGEIISNSIVLNEFIDCK